jgi:hypothetical protein
MNRKTFLKNLAVVFPCCSAVAQAETGKCDTPACTSDAAAVRQFLSAFVRREEATLDRTALVKLLEERGRACCRNLAFRQKLIVDSAGDMNKLVELMGKIVGPENCVRKDDIVTLVYPSGKCGCGWSPQRAPIADDPYCNCSRANNQLLFETVGGKPVRIEVTDSPRRRAGGRCTFIIHLA